ncbi:hypothetical protein NQ314_017969 [Rhamnusium bicolor]|uniref:DDE Tnp4 domain-containing protein n=1 Tax=Rhamnusium bicolor TaxID=1586634 RepID=A0AAV8WRF4_9CUCU|nr:hypothetical protein NQ314_017969 [Rhamnusium bicolor]
MSDLEIAVGAFTVMSASYNYMLHLTMRKRPRRRRWWVTTLHRLRNQYDGHDGEGEDCGLDTHNGDPMVDKDTELWGEGMPTTSDEWLKGAKGFEDKWQFPHCLGALDGKHVLFADIGCHGRMSDGGVFNDSLLYEKISRNNANFPEAAPLPGRTDPVPYVFVADGAFALSSRVMKPFPGVPPNCSQYRIFDQQLSRARVVTEITFGILSSVLRVLRKPILLQPNKAIIVTLTCVILHNFLKKSTPSRILYMPEGILDQIAEENNILRPLEQIPRRSTETARDIRVEFANYFYLRKHNSL